MTTSQAFRSGSKCRGLTMLELLTVVALISILAAIGVPNFLEAQVRSKVTRTYIDMATVALAMKAYDADHGHFPPNHPEVDEALTQLAQEPQSSTATAEMLLPDNNKHSLTHPVWSYQYQLTTPVAYMSQVQADPFNRVTHQSSQGQGTQLPLTVLNLESLSSPHRTRIYGFQVPFLVLSPGPHNQWGRANPANGVLQMYDPTNGTVSRGVIGLFGNQPATQQLGMAAETSSYDRPQSPYSGGNSGSGSSF